MVNILRRTITLRSSLSQIFFKIGVLKNFAIFTGKCRKLLEYLYNKVAGLQVMYVFFIKKRFQHRCFLVNIPKFLNLLGYLVQVRKFILFTSVVLT